MRYLRWWWEIEINLFWSCRGTLRVSSGLWTFIPNSRSQWRAATIDPSGQCLDFFGQFFAVKSEITLTSSNWWCEVSKVRNETCRIKHCHKNNQGRYCTLHCTLHISTLPYTTILNSPLYYTSHNSTQHYSILLNSTLHYTILYTTLFNSTLLLNYTLHYSTLHYT